VFTGPLITEKIAQVIECLVARQLRHVNRADHCSDCRFTVGSRASCALTISPGLQ